MKRALLLATAFWLALILSGCAPKSPDSSSSHEDEASRSSLSSDVSPSSSSVSSANSIDDAAANVLENLWFFDILCESAGKVAEKRDSPIESWEYATNIYGYDFYYDNLYDVYYLFTPKLYRDGLCQEDICEGIVVSIESCFSLTGETPEDMISELSDALCVEFAWVAYEEEEDYTYNALIETSAFSVSIRIYTNEDKEFAYSECGIQFTVDPDYILNSLVED